MADGWRLASGVWRRRESRSPDASPQTPLPRAESREPESDPVVVLYADSSGVVNCVKSGMSASERHQPRAGRTATMKDAAGFGTVA